MISGKMVSKNKCVKNHGKRKTADRVVQSGEMLWGRGGTFVVPNALDFPQNLALIKGFQAQK
jgi:hypothetical protein